MINSNIQIISRAFKSNPPSAKSTQVIRLRFKSNSYFDLPITTTYFFSYTLYDGLTVYLPHDQ